MIKRADRKKRRKRFPSLSAYVVFSISVLLIYTIAELTLTAFTDTAHDTLTTCLFATFGGELLTCAVIKIYKLKGADNE